MKKLLICTDGSDYSEEACRYAAWLAKSNAAEIHALYVTDIRQFQGSVIADLSGSLGIQPYDGMVAQLQEIEEQKAKFVKELTLKVFEEEQVADRVTYHHETGMLVDVIDDFSDDVDLVVLGKRGENANFATEHLGSMLERVIRSTDKPCLVTSRSFKPINRIAIAYDGGASSQKALSFLAAKEVFSSAELHVVTADEGHHEDESAARLAEAEATLKAAGLKATYQLLNGEVESAIADYVENAGIDLLVAGAYGHGRIRELLIGSTTTELLRRCHVPVLCFR
ncbi:MAG: universal stress protein [Opitutales bacterium]|jgi:nucleotide-binding universal stress UspA family protein|nr:universal stress protein [Opitutales bacterium]MDP4776841.1 universal stress protein [Opitutales bacterium]MDP4883275.1 universal stress protein [Opitutales bacterium]MDP5080083.1 universal stress protein [Opitutales bacterium]